MKSGTEDPLNELLASWQVRGEVPAGFQRDVWSRIAAGEDESSWLGRLTGLLLRPLNLGYAAAAAVVVGAVLALMETRPVRQSPHDAYVQSVSPFVSVHLASH